MKEHTGEQIILQILINEAEICDVIKDYNTKVYSPKGQEEVYALQIEFGLKSILQCRLLGNLYKTTFLCMKAQGEKSKYIDI